MEMNLSFDGASSASDSETVKRLLICGVVSGVMFSVVSFVQAFTRSGFDIKLDAISLLSLGDKGWIQSANFILSGLLAIAFARGIKKALRSGRAGKWGPILVAAFGATLITAGIFHADPSYGFPPGAPAGMPDSISWHNGLHGLSFFIGMISLISASIVFARRNAGKNRVGRVTYFILTGVAIPGLIAGSLADQAVPGLFMAGVVVLISAWLIVLSSQMIHELGSGNSKDETNAK